MHNSHFILFSIFSLSSVFNTSLCYAFLVFPPTIDFGFTSESRPVLKWYCLVYLDFSLHNN